MPEASDWLMGLPETEQECEMENKQLLDVTFGDVPAADMRYWKEMGVNIGHS